MRRWRLIALLASGTAFGAWMERQQLLKYWQAYVMPPPPVQTRVYAWQDQAGVWHYSQTADDRRARPIMIDTARITPIKPPSTAPQAAPTDKTLDVMTMREELYRQQQIIQQEKMRRTTNE